MVSCLIGCHGDVQFLSLLESDKTVGATLVDYLDNKNGMLAEMPAVIFYDANSCDQNTNGGFTYLYVAGYLVYDWNVVGDVIDLKMCILEIPQDLTYAHVVYFIPNYSHSIPAVSSQSETKVLMGELFEYGTIPGNSLKALENLLTHVYLPLFQAGAVGKFLYFIHLFVIFFVCSLASQTEHNNLVSSKQPSRAVSSLSLHSFSGGEAIQSQISSEMLSGMNWIQSDVSYLR